MDNIYIVPLFAGENFAEEVSQRTFLVYTKETDEEKVLENIEKMLISSDSPKCNDFELKKTEFGYEYNIFSSVKVG